MSVVPRVTKDVREGDHPFQSPCTLLFLFWRGKSFSWRVISQKQIFVQSKLFVYSELFGVVLRDLITTRTWSPGSWSFDLSVGPTLQGGWLGEHKFNISLNSPNVTQQLSETKYAAANMLHWILTLAGNKSQDTDTRSSRASKHCHIYALNLTKRSTPNNSVIQVIFFITVKYLKPLSRFLSQPRKKSSVVYFSLIKAKQIF